MTGMLRVPRSRGALSGLLLVLLGAWGALIPFIGPYFHYAYTPDTAWTYTTGRLWMEIVPGVAAALGGLILLVSAIRPVAMMGAGIAALGGLWFALGTVLRPLWATVSPMSPGVPVGSRTMMVVEQVGFFTGLGVVIVFFAALALGRLMVIGTRDAMLAEEAAIADRTAPEPATARVPSPRSEDDRVIETGRHHTYAE